MIELFHLAFPQAKKNLAFPQSSYEQRSQLLASNPFSLRKVIVLCGCGEALVYRNGMSRGK